MNGAARYAKVALLCTLFVVLGLALFVRPATPKGDALAYTICALDGPQLVMNVASIRAEDTLPVRMHEDVHVRQCNELGWMKVRWRNLTVGGRLMLEAPGYWAGARARLSRGDNFSVTRERMYDDANAMFAGALDTSQVNAALRAACPEFTGNFSR